ncbi:purine-nucleoside phosphorylase [Vampirovibrio chlorellavorus]|uniref:purine-nucleoside phosphorylase n=1 Tax=Vampirovibrio chlorellavorus TaxID=758823 RepID=UPI0026F09FF4|nr:purine-nucleoside phosphorylase [Vampirovibrio chlorellavorus]
MSFQEQLAEAVAYIQNHLSGQSLKGLVILGSGLGAFADTLQYSVAIDYKNIPHFQKSWVQGHAGRLVIGDVAPGFTIACMQGRFHYYEGHSMETVVFPVRVLKQLGIEFLIVTNAAGGINPAFQPGTLMLIEDHLNLMGDNPLRGENHDSLGPRFPDMSEAYSKPLRVLAQQVAQDNSVELASGVYAGLSGPTYETPAEVRMLRALGADAVGMSTVPEVIAANHMGLSVLGISCITNAACGLSDQKLSHQEVMETAEQARQRFTTLLSGVLIQLASQAAGALSQVGR